MKISKHIRVAMMMVVVFRLAAAQTTPPQTLLPAGSAVISEVKGEVVFNSPQGAPLVVQRGSTLIAESRIETAKGSVLLELQDGSQVLVKAHSNVVLRAPNEGKGYFLELLIGKIVAKVQKRMGGAPSFRMGTPSAVVTVRGTRFSVEVDKKRKTYVEVFEGIVEVRGITEGSPRVLIRPAFSTGVQMNRSPEDPREIDSGEGYGREGGRETEGPGTGRNLEDQPRNQSREGPANQKSEKPD